MLPAVCTVAPGTGATVVTFVGKVTVLLLLPLLATRITPRMRASLRHSMLAAGLAGALSLSGMTAVLPGIRVPLWSARGNSTSASTLDQTGIALTPLSDRTSPHATAAEPPARSGAWPRVDWLFATWAIGTGGCLLPLLAGVWRLHRLRADAIAWPEAGVVCGACAAKHHVTIAVSRAIALPITFGWWRPIILLPVAARLWTRDDLSRVVTHEAAHVARRDWAVHLLATAVCGIYWFHPLAWYVRRRMVLEAERAADDAVLATTDAADYADQLLRLARVASAVPSAVLSMARSQDLAIRIRSVLDRHQARGAATWRGSTGVVLVTMVAVAGLSPLVATAAGFDCVAVRGSDPGPILFGDDPHARVSEQQGGLCRPFGDIGINDTCVSTAAMSADELIVWAFGPDGLVPPSPPIIGGPAWLHSERFDITALAKGREPGDGQRAAMVKNVLVNRFGVIVHRELRDHSGFALMLDVSGTHVNRLQPASTCTGWVPSTPGASRHGQACFSEAGQNYVLSNHLTISALAATLSNRLRTPVVDRSGLSGPFSVNLNWSPDPTSTGQEALPEATIARALADQLGLVLEPITLDEPVIVVDRVHRPALD